MPKFSNHEVSMLAYVAILWLTGCAAPRNIKPGSDLVLNANEGIVIAAVPQGVVLAFRNGHIKDGKFFVDTQIGGKDGLIGESENGWIVQRAAADIAGRANALAFFAQNGKVFVPKCGQQVLMYQVQPQKINYIGHFTILDTQGSADAQVTHQIDAVKKYITNNHKTLNWEVVQARLQHIELGTCIKATPITIPISVPVTR